MNDILLVCLVVSGALVCLLMCVGVIALVYYFLAQSIPAVTRQYAAILLVQKESHEKEKMAIYEQRNKDLEAADKRTQTLLEGRLQEVSDTIARCRYEVIQCHSRLDRLLSRLEGEPCAPSDGGS